MIKSHKDIKKSGAITSFICPDVAQIDRVVKKDFRELKTLNPKKIVSSRKLAIVQIWNYPYRVPDLNP